MTDISRLALCLRDYQVTVERHQADVEACRDRLERSLVRLTSVYDGVAAREFVAHWARTTSQLRGYHDETRAIAAVLAARLTLLEEADRPEGR